LDRATYVARLASKHIYQLTSQQIGDDIIESFEASVVSLVSLVSGETGVISNEFQACGCNGR